MYETAIIYINYKLLFDNTLLVSMQILVFFNCSVLQATFSLFIFFYLPLFLSLVQRQFQPRHLK